MTRAMTLKMNQQYAPEQIPDERFATVDVWYARLE